MTKFEDSVEFRSWGPQPLNHKLKLPDRFGNHRDTFCYVSHTSIFIPLLFRGRIFKIIQSMLAIL
jgi:hypothetical protein